ncbi:MAG: hypothetical protein HYY76_05240 [Acidobacteria bacterium]|nr:hypothetical protein [Acidobacteriota bacterium]
MARRTPRGQLIAVDGGGPAVAAAARHLARVLRSRNGDGGISSWNSSGIFTELAAAEPGVSGPSARTLALLYAADLAFRIRWQIRPAIEAGQWVVAVPYVETIKALGMAAGLPRRWLVELFRFVPKADICYHATDKSRHGNAAKGGLTDSFLSALAASGDSMDPAQLRKRSMEYLTSLERRGRIRRLPPGVRSVRL